MTWPILSLLLAAAPDPTLRLAVVVGSNHAVEGRASLRFAQGDARAVADVLQETGGFAKQDVNLLLEPEPGAVLAAVASAAARAREAERSALFVFYFSGHADDRSLYPGGEPLDLARLKASLEDPAFEVRVGIIDSCRGGGWTQAKGLTPAAAFEVKAPALASEGTALLAASSGLEDAHEAEALQGSFFTHHLVAGLRGAADQSGDGQVTLSEVFAYADRLTIRDTATHSPQPQHPSFDMRLRGRRDVVLAEVGGSPTTLTVAQKEGPLQLVQLSTGVVLVEATPGEQLLRIALPPGGYLVRRLTPEGVRSLEVQVAAGRSIRVDETSLTLVGETSLAPKGVGPRESAHAVALSGGWLAGGSYYNSWTLQATYRWRFSKALALRARGLVGFPVSTGTLERLSAFGVEPPATGALRCIAGADVEWAAMSGQAGPTALALGVSLGASVAGLGSAGGFEVAAVRPAATATATLALSLRSAPELSLFAECLVHAYSAPDESRRVHPQLSLGVAWRFR